LVVATPRDFDSATSGIVNEHAVVPIMLGCLHHLVQPASAANKFLAYQGLEQTGFAHTKTGSIRIGLSQKLQLSISFRVSPQTRENLRLEKASPNAQISVSIGR